MRLGQGHTFAWEEGRPYARWLTGPLCAAAGMLQAPRQAGCGIRARAQPAQTTVITQSCTPVLRTITRELRQLDVQAPSSELSQLSEFAELSTLAHAQNAQVAGFLPCPELTFEGPSHMEGACEELPSWYKSVRSQRVRKPSVRLFSEVTHDEQPAEEPVAKASSGEGLCSAQLRC